MLLLTVVLGVGAFALWQDDLVEQMDARMVELKVLHEFEETVGIIVTAASASPIAGQRYAERFYRVAPARLHSIGREAERRGWTTLADLSGEVATSIGDWERLYWSGGPSAEERMQTQALLALTRINQEVDRLLSNATDAVEEIQERTVHLTVFLVFFLLALSALATYVTYLGTLRPLAKARRRMEQGFYLAPAVKGRLVSVELQSFARTHDNILHRIGDELIQRQKAEERAKDLLEEKTLLLQELFHRTKNGLQIIRSLLNLKAREAPENSELQQVASDVSNKILAISMVHQKLFRSQDLSAVDAREYITDLSRLVVRTVESQPNQVTLSLDVTSLFISVDMAVPLGLVITEVLTNAAKHAFRGIQGPTIRVEFKRHEKSVLIRVADNGPGFPPDLDLREGDSLGVQTVRDIGESQLGGDVRFYNHAGAVCEIEFPYDSATGG